ncbi:hypothetical protein ACSBR2_007691 [Camellia fascicularis]
MTFAQLVDAICGKFNDLVRDAVYMLWDVPGYKKFKIWDVPGGGNYGGAYCNEGRKSNIGNWTFGMDDQTDLLPTYCLNKSKTFQFKYVKNDSVRITAVCKFAESIACTWSMHARVLPSNGILCVKNLDSVHNCGATPLTRPTDIVFDLKNDYGLDISYCVAWLGVEKARGEVYRDHAMSFDQLRLYSDSVMEKNINSYINLEFHQQTGRFKGNLLVATVKDDNKGGNVTVRYGRAQLNHSTTRSGRPVIFQLLVAAEWVPVFPCCCRFS